MKSLKTAAVGVETAMARLGCDKTAARDCIIEAESRRGHWARFMYGQDIGNTLLFAFLCYWRPRIPPIMTGIFLPPGFTHGE